MVGVQDATILTQQTSLQAFNEYRSSAGRLEVPRRGGIRRHERALQHLRREKTTGKTSELLVETNDKPDKSTIEGSTSVPSSFAALAAIDPSCVRSFLLKRRKWDCRTKRSPATLGHSRGHRRLHD